MHRLLTRGRRVGVAMAAVAALALAGCGDDDDDRDTSGEAVAFCAAANPVLGLGNVFESPEDPEEVRRIMREAGDALDALGDQRPEAIAAELATVERIFGPADEALAAVGYDIAAVPDEDVDVLNDLDSVELQLAADAIWAWAAENCEDVG